MVAMPALETPLEARGEAMHAPIERLYPICRSITGDGVRETLAILGEELPLEVHEVPSGTRVFDWTVPPEWNIREAYVADSRGRRLIDFADSNLHVVSYSQPLRRTMTFAELRPHLHTLPEQPRVIPYRTTYYEPGWGFCLRDDDLAAFREDERYKVVIDASLDDGHLTYGELFLPGESREEVLISTHLCHPSLCNDNLSGIALASALARELAAGPRRLSYRFLFIPGTIGSIAWLARNAAKVGQIEHGLVLSAVGDRGAPSYKRSRRGDAPIDRAMAHLLSGREGSRVLDFSPYGYDERQFCSPGFDLPVGSFSRSRHGEYPQYHTSADDLDFVSPGALEDSLDLCLGAFALLEANTCYENLNPHCEPQLGRRGLYRAMGGHHNPGDAEMAMLWVLNLADGKHDLLAMAERSGLPAQTLHFAATTLIEHGLLAERPRTATGGRG